MNIAELLKDNVQVNSTIVEVASTHDVENYKKVYSSPPNVEFISGLYMGLYVDKTTIYLLIATSNKTLILVDIEEYNIMSIICNYSRPSSNKYTDYMYIREDHKDQIYAQQILYKVLVNYQKNNKVMLDTEIVDISKLSDYNIDMPALHSVQSDLKKETNTNMNEHYLNQRAWYVGQHDQTKFQQTPVADHRTISAIKRQSKKPTKIFLDKMLEMVSMVEKGEYTANINVTKQKPGITQTEVGTDTDPDENADAWVNKCLAGYY